MQNKNTQNPTLSQAGEAVFSLHRQCQSFEKIVLLLGKISAARKLSPAFRKVLSSKDGKLFESLIQHFRNLSHQLDGPHVADGLTPDQVNEISKLLASMR